MSSSILGITYSPTAGSMDAIKGADLQEVHPWKLLALCSSSDPAINVAAIHAIKEVGRDRLCSALQGGYAELIDRILSEISDPSPDVRSAMAQAFGVLAVEGDELVRTQDDDPDVREAAVFALGALAPIGTLPYPCWPLGQHLHAYMCRILGTWCTKSLSGSEHSLSHAWLSSRR